jgi:hypothetical protein
MSHRDGDVWDAVANSIGAVSVFLFWLGLRAYCERRFRRSRDRLAVHTSAAAVTDLSSATSPATGRPTPT